MDLSIKIEVPRYSHLVKNVLQSKQQSMYEEHFSNGCKKNNYVCGNRNRIEDISLISHRYQSQLHCLSQFLAQTAKVLKAMVCFSLRNWNQRRSAHGILWIIVLIYRFVALKIEKQSGLFHLSSSLTTTC